MVFFTRSKSCRLELPVLLTLITLAMISPVVAQTAAGVDKPALVAPGAHGRNSETVPVIERFRTYSGARSLPTLVALFEHSRVPGIVQQPEIAVSDGESAITIELKLDGHVASAPNFACKGARLVSIGRNSEGKWVVTILPEKGSWNVGLIILAGPVVREVPLVVSPALPPGISTDEQAFQAYASRSGQDLNGDGKWDYIDDYIFTANYLISQRSMKPSHDSASQPEAKAGQAALPGALTPGSGPGIDAKSGTAIKPESLRDKRNYFNRNERARKMKEIINSPAQ